MIIIVTTTDMVTICNKYKLGGEDMTNILLQNTLSYDMLMCFSTGSCMPY